MGIVPSERQPLDPTWEFEARADAIEAVLSGRISTSTDSSRSRGEGEHYAVMAGMGIDAMIMAETGPSEGQDRTADYFCRGPGPGRCRLR